MINPEINLTTYDKDVEALKLLRQELKGKTIFYPGCWYDITVAEALGDISKVIHNDHLDVKSFEQMKSALIEKLKSRNETLEGHLKGKEMTEQEFDIKLKQGCDNECF